MPLTSTIPRLTHLLGSASNLLGLGDYRLNQIFRRAASLRLSFSQPLSMASSIWWQQNGLPTLAQLPRCALSGPVQEDKVAAYRVLSGLVDKTCKTLEQVDLREIDGLVGSHDEPFEHLEDWVEGHLCRRYRIISYQDFERVISLALPGFLAGDAIELISASWYPNRLFWAGEQQREAFACAVAYARVRELSARFPARIAHYQLNIEGLKLLRNQYHALFMPHSAWTTSKFMRLLLEGNIPYARLAKLHTDYQEVLLLPRNRKRSNALGLGLRKAGAFDAADWLSDLIEPYCAT